MEQMKITELVSRLLEKDKRLGEVFTELLLNGKRRDEKSISNFVDIAYPHIVYPIKKDPRYRKIFLAKLRILLNSQRMNGFVRMIQLIRDIYKPLGLPDKRLVNYVRSLKFGLTGNINYYRTSVSLGQKLEPMKIKSFAELSDKQKYLLRGLAKEEIDQLEKLTLEEVLKKSKTCHFTSQHLALIRQLTREECKIYEKFGPDRFRIILNLNDASKRRIFNLSLREKQILQYNRQEQLRLLKNINVDENRIDLVDAIGSLFPRELELLPVLVKKWEPMPKDLETEMIDLIFELRLLNSIGDNQFLTFDDRQKKVLLNLDGEQLDVIAEFDHFLKGIVFFQEVFEMASNLSKQQLNLILSFDNEEIKSIASMAENGKLFDIAKFNHHQRGRLLKFGNMRREVQIALFQLTTEQRKILSKAYGLGKDGLKMITHLSDAQFYDVMKMGRWGENVQGGLNLVQKVLLRKIKDMESSRKERLLNLTENELKELYQMVKSNKPELLELNNIGLMVLEAMTVLNEQHLAIVWKLSNENLTVLARNSNINPDTILRLNELTEEKGKFLINLDLNQRNNLKVFGINENNAKVFLEKELNVLHGLTRDEKELLMKMVSLNPQEIKEMHESTGQFENFVQGLSEKEREVCGSLREEAIHGLSNILTPRVEDVLFNKIFGVYLISSLQKQGVVSRLVKNELERMKKYSLGIRLSYIKLIASLVTTRVMLKQNAFAPLGKRVNIFDRIAFSMEKVLDHSSASMFYLFAFKYSIRDGFKRDDSLYIIGKVRQIKSDYNLQIGKLFDFGKVQEITMFRKMLTESKGRDIMYRISREVLLELRGKQGVRDLYNIIGREDEHSQKEVVWALKKQLKDEDYFLAKEYFFHGNVHDISWNKVTPMSRVLSDILESHDITNFFRLPVTGSLLLVAGFPRDILEDKRLSHPNLLECCLYYGVGDVLTLLRKVTHQHVFQLSEEHAVRLLALCARGKNIDLLRFFSSRIGSDRIAHLIWRNMGGFFTLAITQLSKSNELKFPIGHDNPIHRLSGWLKEIDPEMRLYRSLVHMYIANAQNYLPPETLSHVITSFANEHVSLEELYTEIQSQLEPAVRDSILKLFATGCGASRIKRNVRVRCVDSTNKENHLEEFVESSNLGKTIENIKFYEDILKASVQDGQIRKIVHSELKSKDPIVKELQGDIEKGGKLVKSMKQIEKAANAVGLAYTIFSVGKHVVSGNLQGLGYDTLNLWVMPKLGDKISQKITSIGGKYESQLIKGFAPVIGHAVGNFAAFLGLMESIKAKINATDPIDEKIADLNIATNSIFIAADVPAVVTEIMAVVGVETGVLGAIAGPIGIAVSIPVLIIADFIQAGLEVDKLEEKINLTSAEKSEFYWDFFLSRTLPDYISWDVELKDVYEKYLAEIIQRFEKDYDKMGISLPPLLVTKQEYLVYTYLKKRQIVFDWVSHCSTSTRVLDLRFDDSTNATSDYPFHVKHDHHLSRIVPNKIRSFNLFCGPSDDDAKVTVNKTIIDTLSPNTCTKGLASNKELSRIIQKIYIPEFGLDHCRNMVLLEKDNSTNSKPILYYFTQNLDMIVSKTDSFDIFFQARTISVQHQEAIVDTRDLGEGRYHLPNDLEACKIHKEGLNFFYINSNKLVCDFGVGPNRQTNVAVVKTDFQDTPDIHSIIGSEGSDRIQVSYAEFVDGRGGNDTIIAHNFTTVKAYSGDVIQGTSMVLLPFRLNEIIEIRVDNWFEVYDVQDRFVQIGIDSSFRTADGFLVTQTRIDNETLSATHLHVHKTVQTVASLQDERTKLIQVSNPNFKLVKQLSSSNYDLIISDHGGNVFHADKNNHNFYWETSDDSKHLYMFDRIDCNITVSRASGIFNFQLLNSTLNDTSITTTNDGRLHLKNEQLQVTLLPDYGDIQVTFDGVVFHQFKYGQLEQNYCSHPLNIDSRFIINGTDLNYNYNCFVFPSDRALFFKLDNDLLISSGRQVLMIIDYYTSVYKVVDLSLKLNDNLLTPEKFRKLSEEPNSIKLYKAGEDELEIYHNQPRNKRHIGLVDLRNQSVLDFHMKIIDHRLELSSENRTIVKIENWDAFAYTRELIFTFTDSIIDAYQCILSYCDPKTIVQEFLNEKRRVATADSSPQNISPSYSKIGSDNESIDRACVGINIGLAYLLLQSFLDTNYPLPKFKSTSGEELLADASNITELFARVFKKTAKRLNIDVKSTNFFTIYSNVASLMRNGRYSQLPSIFTTFAENFASGNKRFQRILKNNVKKMFEEDFICN